MEIPIKAAEEIAKKYGYDQIVIIGRVVDTDDKAGWEHVTTYGVNKDHCQAAATIGNHLKYKVMGWPQPKSAAYDYEVHCQTEENDEAISEKL